MAIASKCCHCGFSVAPRALRCNRCGAPPLRWRRVETGRERKTTSDRDLQRQRRQRSPAGAAALAGVHPDEVVYTYWDYFRNAFGRNAGLRMDHLLLSPELTPRLRAAEVDRDVRGWERISDHAPVWIDLER